MAIFHPAMLVYQRVSVFCGLVQKYDAVTQFFLVDFFFGFAVGWQDAHSSEYVCSADERRSFLTGFSGSSGSALVTADEVRDG